jgi:hypothetical protein
MKRSIAIAAGLAATLALVACGDDDEGGSGSANDYCTLIVSFQEKSEVVDDVLSSSDSSPADVEDAMNAVKPMVAQLQSAAPAEIKADVETMASATLRMIEIFEQYEYDFMALSTAPELAEIEELTSSAEVEAASERLNDYEETTCGISPES